jgi:3-methyladenine DNA glycosylase/8-oxoguanine DNA glycosylase
MRYFVAHDDMINSANRTKEIAPAMNKTPLSLKAKVVSYHEEEDDDADQEEEEPRMTSSSELDVDLAFLVKKYGNFTMNRGTLTKERKHDCYNCEESGHFSDKFPYEKRKHKPKYTNGVKAQVEA